MIARNLWARLAGNPVRIIREEQWENAPDDTNRRKPIYLTFDDGPDPDSTEPVLELLDLYGVPATFFVVAERARKERALFSAMIAAGHAIGNHSLDHHYAPFFQGRRAMSTWIHRSENALLELFGQPPVGFRPPAGVRTPELAHALRKAQLPLVLWKVRFYDSVRPFRQELALRSVSKTPRGSIVLLHDRQKERNLGLFLQTLGFYIEILKQGGFEFRILTRSLCAQSAEVPPSNLQEGK